MIAGCASGRSARLKPSAVQPRRAGAAGGGHCSASPCSAPSLPLCSEGVGSPVPVQLRLQRAGVLQCECRPRGCGWRRDGPEQRAWRRSTGLRQARGAVRNKIQAAPVLRTDVWRRSVGQPLQTGVAARWRMLAQDIEHGAAPREPIASAVPVREAQAQAKATCVRAGGSVVPGSVGSRKPVARPHVWQKLGLAKMGVESARREKLPTMRPIAWSTVIRYSGRRRARKDVLPGRTLGPVAAASLSTRSSRTHRSAASGRRWSMTGKESAQAAQ